MSASSAENDRRVARVKAARRERDRTRQALHDSFVRVREAEQVIDPHELAREVIAKAVAFDSWRAASKAQNEYRAAVRALHRQAL